jgi:hypothetical protein
VIPSRQALPGVALMSVTMWTVAGVAAQLTIDEILDGGL